MRLFGDHAHSLSHLFQAGIAAPPSKLVFVAIVLAAIACIAIALAVAEPH